MGGWVEPPKTTNSSAIDQNPAPPMRVGPIFLQNPVTTIVYQKNVYFLFHFLLSPPLPVTTTDKQFEIQTIWNSNHSILGGTTLILGGTTLILGGTTQY